MITVSTGSFQLLIKKFLLLDEGCVVKLFVSLSRYFRVTLIGWSCSFSHGRRHCCCATHSVTVLAFFSVILHLSPRQFSAAFFALYLLQLAAAKVRVDLWPTVVLEND